MLRAGYTLHPLDVEFDRVPIRAYSTAGTPYLRWVPCGMPKLEKYAGVLKTVFFLYETVDAAIRGKSSGGTGFFVAVKSERFPQINHIHGITNYHVAIAPPDGPSASVIRLNRLDGGVPATFDLGPDEWIFRPKWHDIAVSPPLSIDFDVHDVVPFQAETFWLTSDQEKSEEIGAADDVFMIGRFIDCDRIESNNPALRFGHISIMDVKIEQPTGYIGRSIVVDLHSRSGFSGSPVVVYRTLGSYFMDIPQHSVILGGKTYVRLLGILWGAFPEEWELRDKKRAKEVKRNTALITDGRYVEGLSGMSCIIPSAYIEDLVMNDPKLKAMRADRDNEIARQQGSRRAPIPLSAAGSAVSSETTLESDENPDHLEDFTRLVSAASKRKPKGDRT
jgi:hypothetical protein